MKKVLCIMLAMASFSLISHAQSTANDKKPKQEKTGTKDMKSDSTANHKKDKSSMEENLKSLNLSADQKKQLDQMHKDMHEQKEKIKNDNSLSEEQKNQKLKDMEKDYKSKMSAVLTKEQKQQLQDEKKKKKEEKEATGKK